MERSGIRAEQHACRPTAWQPLTANDVSSSIGDRFRAQVEAHGGCLAVTDGDTTLTYRELDGWASAIAEEDR